MTTHYLKQLVNIVFLFLFFSAKVLLQKTYQSL